MSDDVTADVFAGVAERLLLPLAAVVFAFAWVWRWASGRTLETRVLDPGDLHAAARAAPPITMREIDRRRAAANRLLQAAQDLDAVGIDSSTERTALAYARAYVEQGLKRWWAQRDAEGWR